MSCSLSDYDPWFCDGHFCPKDCETCSVRAEKRHPIEQDDNRVTLTPVRHGRNIYYTVIGHCEFKCSECGVELSTVYGGKNHLGMDGGYFKYCPYCGARMDGAE